MFHNHIDFDDRGNTIQTQYDIRFMPGRREPKNKEEETELLARFHRAMAKMSEDIPGEIGIDFLKL